MGKKKEKETPEVALEKLPIKDLKAEAAKIDGVEGVYGMTRQELVSAVRKSKGMEEQKPGKGGSIRDLKSKMNDLRKKRDEERAQGATKDRLNILRRKIAGLKRLSRKSA